MKIGILGFGVVGSGVYEIIRDNVLKIFDLPFKQDLIGEKYVSDPYDIVLNPNIDIVVETLGGVNPAYELIKTALINKKHVVTSNKEVVSKHFKEFIELSKENNVYFMFEASVGGGIPIIHSLIESIKTDEVSHIYGIINGTSNYILTNIEANNMSFDEALNKATINGFAEKNPSADIDGLDLSRKITILSDIAYNSFIDTSSVKTRSMRIVTKEMIDFLNGMNKTIKYVAESFIKNNEILLTVEPIVIDKDNPLSRVNYEYNSIFYNTKNNGLLEFFGKGAGKYPTASQVVADIERIKNNKPFYPTLTRTLRGINPPKSEYFIYSLDEINEDIISKRYGNFYFTKKISENELNERMNYIRINLYEEI